MASKMTKAFAALLITASLALPAMSAGAQSYYSGIYTDHLPQSQGERDARYFQQRSDTNFYASQSRQLLAEADAYYKKGDLKNACASLMQAMKSKGKGRSSTYSNSQFSSHYQDLSSRDDLGYSDIQQQYCRTA
jgi:hypothetical protein